MQDQYCEFLSELYILIIINNIIDYIHKIEVTVILQKHMSPIQTWVNNVNIKDF